MTDSGNALATATQYKEAINEAVMMWQGRVTLPRVYNITGGFSAGTYEYTLPSYIRPPFRVQIRSSTYTYLGVQLLSDDDNFTWHDLAGWEIEPVADAGGYLLRMPMPVYTDDARIIWWQENGPLPTGTITLKTTMNSTVTSAVIAEETQYLTDSGFLKMDNEWMAFAGLSNDGTDQTFENLHRGLGASAAAAHTSGITIHFGVGVDDQRLWIQLYDYVAAYIHGLQLHKGTTEDVSRHEKLMSFYTQRADGFWRTAGYISQRKPKMRQTSRGVGPLLW